MLGVDYVRRVLAWYKLIVHCATCHHRVEQVHDFAIFGEGDIRAFGCHDCNEAYWVKEG